MPLPRAKTIPIITFRAKFDRRKLAHFVLESTIFKPPEKKKKGAQQHYRLTVSDFDLHKKGQRYLFKIVRDPIRGYKNLSDRDYFKCLLD